jgi:hypothetical protein
MVRVPNRERRLVVIVALSDTSVELQASDRWIIAFAVYDDDGNTPTDDPAPVVNVTGPDGGASTPDVVLQTDGTYRSVVQLASTGRSVANVYTPSYGVLGFVANGTGNITTAQGMPSVASVQAYAGGSLSDSWLNADIQAALDSEASQQRKRLNIPAVFPPDLFEALCRRVVFALDRRQKLNAGDFSTGIVNGEGQAFIPADPEIRRLEAPYRKVVMI